MKTRILPLLAILLMAFSTQAQWTTSGANIYNSNSGNVGIGNTSPDSKLVITRNNWQLKLTNPNAGSWDWRLGSSSADWYTGGQRFVISHTVNSQDATFCIDGSTSAFNVGIGMISPSYKLDVNGAVRATVYYTTSDERFKKDINKLSNSLSRITNLNGYTYSFKTTPSSNFPQGNQIGLLAQQVEKEFPEIVKKDNDGMLAVNYTALIPVMIEAIKELKSELDITKAELKEAKLLIESTKTFKKDERKSYQFNIYPNPSSGYSIFDYDLGESGKLASIVVKDMNGETVKVFENIGSKGKIDFNTTLLKPGVYHYSLIIDKDVVQTERMLVK